MFARASLHFKCCYCIIIEIYYVNIAETAEIMGRHAALAVIENAE